jgi:hypothetical protein
MGSNFAHKFMWNCGNVVFDILKMFNNLCLFLKLVDMLPQIAIGVSLRYHWGIFGINEVRKEYEKHDLPTLYLSAG